MDLCEPWLALRCCTEPVLALPAEPHSAGRGLGARCPALPHLPNLAPRYLTARFRASPYLPIRTLLVRSIESTPCLPHQTLPHGARSYPDSACTAEGCLPDLDSSHRANPGSDLSRLPWLSTRRTTTTNPVLPIMPIQTRLAQAPSPSLLDLAESYRTMSWLD